MHVLIRALTLTQSLFFVFFGFFEAGLSHKPCGETKTDKCAKTLCHGL